MTRDGIDDRVAPDRDTDYEARLRRRQHAMTISARQPRTVDHETRGAMPAESPASASTVASALPSPMGPATPRDGLPRRGAKQGGRQSHEGSRP